MFLSKKGVLLWGILLALPTNIRLGWKVLSGTNTQAYFKKWEIVGVKSFIILSPGHSVVKLFGVK